MAVSWDSPGSGGEMGRVRGQKGSFYGKYEGLEKNLPDLIRPGLPPKVAPGGHGGSHPHLANEFISSIVEGRPSFPDVYQSLNWTCAGICAHDSAMRAGAIIQLPDFRS